MEEFLNDLANVVYICHVRMMGDWCLHGASKKGTLFLYCGRMV